MRPTKLGGRRREGGREGGGRREEEEEEGGREGGREEEGGREGGRKQKWEEAGKDRINTRYLNTQSSTQFDIYQRVGRLSM